MIKSYRFAQDVFITWNLHAKLQLHSSRNIRGDIPLAFTAEAMVLLAVTSQHGQVETNTLSQLR